VLLPPSKPGPERCVNLSACDVKKKKILIVPSSKTIAGNDLPVSLFLSLILLS
jgi:hypothetical protein